MLDVLRPRMKRIALLVLAVAACASPAASPITLHAGDDGRVELAGGQYRVSWQQNCNYFTVEIAPTDRTTSPIEIPVDNATTGEVTVVLPAGSAYVNRGGVCADSGGYSVTLTPA
jgi:hypothetical protein